MAQAETSHERAAEALERLPQRRVASLYDVAVQYSILDWYQTVTEGDLSFDLAPEHLAFMTPNAKPDLFGEEDNALVVYVDLSDREHPTFRDDKPVQFETVGPSQRFELGHSYPANKTSSMTDYSVTTHKSATEHHLAGERDDSWGTANVRDRFTRWARSDAADRVLERDDIEDAWIIGALQTLGEDEAALDELVARPDFPLDPTDEETEHEVFVTIRVRLPGEDRYRWPGEIPALNEVMVEQKADRFENISVEDAAGDGVGYVTGEDGRVTGGSAGVLGMYAKKQREHFPDLSVDGTEAWRARPVTRETAAALATANTVFEEFYQALGASRRLYVLPYIGADPEAVSPAEFDAFATRVFGRLRAAEPDDFEAVVDRVFYERDGEETGSLGLFAETEEDEHAHTRVATAFTVSGNPDRVFFEALRTDVYRPREVELAHEEVIHSREFADTGIFAAAVRNVDSPVLAVDSPPRSMAFFGGYFDRTTEPTRYSYEASDEPKAGDIDDLRARRLRQFLTGQQIPVEPLLEEYVHKLVQRQRERFGRDDAGNVPATEILEQYVQLRVLEEADVLAAATDEPTIESPTRDIASVTRTRSDTEYESRESRLEDFVQSHDVLAGSESRQAVFLLGALVGRITAYQHHEDVSSTLVRRYPIDYLTKQSIKEVTKEVLQMNNTYIDSDENLSGSYNARFVDRLPDLMLSADPSSWSFPQSELQWLYALGIAYGNNDTSIHTEE